MPSAARVRAVDKDQGRFSSRRLEQVFSDCFAASFHTFLRGGASEPHYQPGAGPGAEQHVLYYRYDYFASALHEVAHWCIAGDRRRQLVDFGYWYAPDGRDASQQLAFEEVEYKPQALEWFFSRACGYRFRLSADNLDAQTGEMPDTLPFAQAVLRQALYWREHGLPSRAALFFDALEREFGTGVCAPQLELTLAELTE